MISRIGHVRSRWSRLKSITWQFTPPTSVGRWSAAYRALHGRADCRRGGYRRGPSAVLRRFGLNWLSALEPAEPLRRYERAHPGELIPTSTSRSSPSATQFSERIVRERASTRFITSKVTRATFANSPIAPSTLHSATASSNMSARMRSRRRSPAMCCALARRSGCGTPSAWFQNRSDTRPAFLLFLPERLRGWLSWTSGFLALQDA